jgi:outer membrane protein OmpA-like peptidoglycan-associated protein
MKTIKSILIAACLMIPGLTGWSDSLEIRERQNWVLKSGGSSHARWLPGTVFVSTNEPCQNYQGEKVLVVQFENNSDTLIGLEKDRLQEIAGNLKGEEIIVEGHACWMGRDEYNQDLSERRSYHVASVLREHGVTVVGVRGWGESRIKTYDNPAANRRVEIYQITKKEK